VEILWRKPIVADRYGRSSHVGGSDIIKETGRLSPSGFCAVFKSVRPENTESQPPRINNKITRVFLFLIRMLRLRKAPLPVTNYSSFLSDEKKFGRAIPPVARGRNWRKCSKVDNRPSSRMVVFNRRAQLRAARTRIRRVMENQKKQTLCLSGHSAVCRPTTFPRDLVVFHGFPPFSLAQSCARMENTGAQKPHGTGNLTVCKKLSPIRRAVSC